MSKKSSSRTGAPPAADRRRGAADRRSAAPPARARAGAPRWEGVLSGIDRALCPAVFIAYAVVGLIAMAAAEDPRSALALLLWGIPPLLTVRFGLYGALYLFARGDRRFGRLLCFVCGGLSALLIPGGIVLFALFPEFPGLLILLPAGLLGLSAALRYRRRHLL